MRNSIEKWLQNIWYSDITPPWYLRMLVPLYSAGFKFDHRPSNSSKPYSNKSNSSNPNSSRPKSDNPRSVSDHSGPAQLEANSITPLLVVGNITVGGSGKTPLVIKLCEIAQKLGVKVGVASTGYGRKSVRTLQVQADSDTNQCGDEPVLVAIRTDATVVVAKRRQDAITQLRQMNLDLIISDDGLQTAGLSKDIEICVVDGARGMGNGYLLPAGPLREPVSRLQDVDYVVSNGQWLSKPVNGSASLMKLGQMTLKGQMLCSLDGAHQLSSSEFFSQKTARVSGHQVHLVAGIGNPDRFFSAVRQLSQDIVAGTAESENWQEHRFADHHAFASEDFDTVPEGATILMTEKDAVKCRKLGLENAWYLPVDAVLDEEFVDWFCQQLELLKQDKP